VTLDASAEDKFEYSVSKQAADSRIARVRLGGATRFTVEMAIACRRRVAQLSRVKRQALFADLEKRAKGTTGCRAVAFGVQLNCSRNVDRPRGSEQRGEAVSARGSSAS